MIEAGSAQAIRHAAQAYSAVGALVAVAFLAFGLARVAHGARGAYAFRPLLLPGLVLLWPLVLWRWALLARAAGHEPVAIGLGRRYVGVHRAAWLLLAVLLPLLLVGALSLRQSGPLETAPVRLAGPQP